MAEKTYLHDLDLNLNQLLNAVIQQLGVDPAAVEGQVWYKTGDKRISYYDGVQNQRVANLNDITGLWSLQGPYNAATNTPNLVTPAAGTVLKGYAYVVTTGGDFYGEQLEIGDVIMNKYEKLTIICDKIGYKLLYDSKTIDKKYIKDITNYNEVE